MPTRHYWFSFKVGRPEECFTPASFFHDGFFPLPIAAADYALITLPGFFSLLFARVHHCQVSSFAHRYRITVSRYWLSGFRPLMPADGSQLPEWVSRDRHVTDSISSPSGPPTVGRISSPLPPSARHAAMPYAAFRAMLFFARCHQSGD